MCSMHGIYSLPAFGYLCYWFLHSHFRHLFGIKQIACRTTACSCHRQRYNVRVHLILWSTLANYATSKVFLEHLTNIWYAFHRRLQLAAVTALRRMEPQNCAYYRQTVYIWCGISSISEGPHRVWSLQFPAAENLQFQYWSASLVSVQNDQPLYNVYRIAYSPQVTRSVKQRVCKRTCEMKLKRNWSKTIL